MIRLGRHSLVLGQTGSGKSQLLLHLAKVVPFQRVIFDTKIDDDFLYLNRQGEKSLIVNSPEGFCKALKADFHLIVVRPSDEDNFNHKALDHYLSLAYQAKDMAIFLDEAYPFHSAAGRAGFGVNALLTRGRSRGLSLIAAAQRPAWISNYFFSECSSFFIYRLMQSKDRKRVADNIPYNGEIPDKFHFYYYDVDNAGIMLCKPVALHERVGKPTKKRLFF